MYAVTTMYRVLEVSTSGCYAWLKREPSIRARQDSILTKRIIEIHEWSDGTYGVPRIHDELIDSGEVVGRKRITRLMKGAGLQGVSRRKKTVTTQSDAAVESEPDLVNRDFRASAPNQLWVSDITYIPTWAGFLYLAVVLDDGADGSSVGRWRTIYEPSWCSTRSTWQLSRGGPPA